MGVDEQRMTIGIQILGKAGEMDLPGRREGQRLDERGVTPAAVQTLDDIALLPFTVKTDLRDTYPFG